jgi:MFS transporter, DHA2 family, multidrug resistance protein
MDLTVLALAVPSLSADPRPSSAQLLWITDISGFLLAGSLITIGPWATASDDDGGWPER